MLVEQYYQYINCDGCVCYVLDGWENGIFVDVRYLFGLGCIKVEYVYYIFEQEFCLVCFYFFKCVVGLDF